MTRGDLFKPPRCASAADIDMTWQVADAGRALGIAMHDHIVIVRDGISSFKGLGLF